MTTQSCLVPPKLLLLLTIVIGFVHGFSFFTSKPKRSNLLLLDVGELPVKLPADVTSRRGMTTSMENEAYSNEKKFFQCNYKKNEISIQFVNDDYCDCHDCSDEPGIIAINYSTLSHPCIRHILTPYIANSVGTSAAGNDINRFVCINKGYRLIEIPKSRVDDGICDCCDGSDEGSLMQCPNICDQVAQNELKSLNKLKTAYSEGSKIKAQYLAKALHEYDSKASPLAHLINEIERLENNVKLLKQDMDNENNAIEKVIDELVQDSIKKSSEYIGRVHSLTHSCTHLLTHSQG